MNQSRCLLGLLLLLATPLSVPATEYGWRAVTLDDDFPGSLLDAKVDSLGRLNLLVDRDNLLQHGFFQQGELFRPDILWAGDFNRPRMEILPDGSPVIAFSNPDSLLLWAEWVPDEEGVPGPGGSPIPSHEGHWETSVIDSGGGGSFDVWAMDMTVDLAGTPHVVIDASVDDGRFVYWRRPGKDWLRADLFDGDTTKYWSSGANMVTDAGGQVHLFASVVGVSEYDYKRVTVDALLPQETLADTLINESCFDEHGVCNYTGLARVRLAESGELTAMTRNASGVGFRREVAGVWEVQGFDTTAVPSSPLIYSAAGGPPHALVPWSKRDSALPVFCKFPYGTCLPEPSPGCELWCEFEDYVGYYYSEGGTWKWDRLSADVRGVLVYDEAGFPMIVGALDGKLIAYRRDSPTSIAGGQEGAVGSSLRVVPNPGRSEFRFRITGNRAIRTAEVYDVRGRRVVAFEWNGGRSEFQWDGRDADRRRAAQGIYFVRIDLTDGESLVRKVTLLR